MTEKPRGAALTILALLLALMAVSDFGKLFAHHQGIGFVFQAPQRGGVRQLRQGFICRDLARMLI